MISRTRVLIAAVVLILASAVAVQSSLGQCYMPPSPGDNEERIFAQSACSGVSNDPPNPTIFTIDDNRILTKIGTYHWNNGEGDIPGTIGLKSESGKTFGPWQATGLPGQGGVPNAYWVVDLTPGVELPSGTYTILDSNPATWAYNGESDDSGIAAVIALKVGSDKGKQAPCAGEGADYSPRPPTDPYSAGPSLVPGSYNVWYGKRTGSNIGKPDSWNKLGPVELEDGEFYVFDVTTEDLAKANPQMVNPMLTKPTPGESLVWLKLSAKDPYVICFEGPLGGGIQLAGSWKMYGHQTDFNDWEADLSLKKDGTIQWTETKGANVGATRQGTWTFDSAKLTLEWTSPGGGQTSWISQSVTQDSIADGMYTVEMAPGGTWSATRIQEGI